MPSTTIVCGVLLILIGLVGYGYGMTDGHGSPTALIPAVLGLILAILGFAAKSKENLRKHIMHGAVVVGLLGFLGTAGSFLQIPAFLNGTAGRPAAVVAQLATALVCLMFVVLCVKSFIDARRNRAI
jgi:O-antigen/teichoic acid export membrane protein